MELSLHSDTQSTDFLPISEYLVQGTIVHRRYCVERSIAMTSAHIVYIGTDLTTRGEVIVKHARHQVCSYGAHCQACLDLVAEGMMLLRLKRSGIPAPHFLAQLHIHRRPYLVMTRIPGQTLESLDRARRLHPAQAMRYIIQLCRSLQATHRLGYVHHDVKPANIIICPDDTPMLIDWGSAQQVRAPGDCRAHHTGTPDYVSPEQARGEAQPGNDIFALAMTLDALIARPGRRLEAIILRATGPYDQRYRTVADFQRALSHLDMLDRLVNRFGLTAI